jgi:PAS domain S-box-containing protein
MSTSDGHDRAPLEFRAFIDGIPALAWTALPDGSPEFFNQQFPDYSGLSSDQIFKNWKSTLHQDDVEKFETWWQALQKFTQPDQTEVRFRRSDGEYRWFQISATPVHDKQGNLVRW